jgi:hypothetical protein
VILLAVISLVGALILGGMVAGSAAHSGHITAARRKFAAANGLATDDGSTFSGNFRGLQLVLEFLRGEPGQSVPLTKLTLSGLALPVGFSLATQRLGEQGWQLGDPELDRRVKIDGPPGFLAYALGEEQREQVLDLARAGGTFRVSGDEIVIVGWREQLDALSQVIAAAFALAEHLCAPAHERAAALKQRATSDPLPILRVAAIYALQNEFPSVLTEALPTLRRDHAPAVMLAVAIASREPADAECVPTVMLTPVELRELWTHCRTLLAPAERTALLRLIAARTGDAEEETRFLDAALSEAGTQADALALLDERGEAVRLVGVRWLGQKGEVDAVAPLRALEASNVLARAQAKACEAAVLQIQSRLQNAEAGAVSIDDAARGALSKPKQEA